MGEAFKNGWQLLAHCNGDAAADQFIRMRSDSFLFENHGADASLLRRQLNLPWSGMLAPRGRRMGHRPVLSGVMSAHALLNAGHYDAVWRREIGPAIETSVVNRAVYSLLGNRGYRWLLRSQAWTGDARSFLRWLYGTASVHRVLAGVGLLTRYCSVISWPARC